jgi:hypothetical protein
LGRRAITALTAGTSAPINNQLAARGHQVSKMRVIERGAGEAVLTAIGDGFYQH